MQGAYRITFRDPYQRRHSWWRRLFNLLILAAACWALGLLVFAAAIPNPRQVRDSDRPTDAIIVLTGGGDRLAEGFRLLDRGLAKKLLISGVAQGVTLEQLIDGLGADRAAAPTAGELACCVTLGYVAASTAGNALESAHWIAENGFHSVRLVTANYHMMRSLLEFRRTAPTVEVIPHPVFPAEVKDPYWFVHPKTVALIVNEYHKYLVALGRAGSDSIGQAGAGLGHYAVDLRAWIATFTLPW
jgi:uncharacterized SAM-binding protein YcdF (DUF218 family)